MNKPSLSLIICSRNRGSKLQRCLKSISTSEMLSVGGELILVNSDSTDETEEIMTNFKNSAPFQVTYVRANRPGLGLARRIGVDCARSDVCVFTDDDCYLKGGFLGLASTIFSDDRFQYCGGRILLFDETDAPIACSLSKKFELIPPFSFIPAGKLQGANLLVHRRVLETIGSFDDAIGAGTRFRFEDIDLVARASMAGFTGAHVPELIVYHHHGRKAGIDLEKLKKQNDFARGAFYMKMGLQGHRKYVATWIRRMVRSRRFVKSIRELAGALTYFVFRLFKRGGRC